MKRRITLTIAIAALVLVGCSTPQDAPAPSPAAISAPASSKVAAAVPASSSAASAETDESEADAEATLPSGLTESEALEEFKQCMEYVEAEDNPSDESYALCESGLEFDLMTEDETQELGEQLTSPLWQCYLELEETRPELFTSADPEQYSQDPAVIAECGKP